MAEELRNEDCGLQEDAEELSRSQLDALHPYGHWRCACGAYNSADLKRCGGCQRERVTTKNGKSAPFTADGLNHFADCPKADRFRNKGKT